MDRKDKWHQNFKNSYIEKLLDEPNGAQKYKGTNRDIQHLGLSANRFKSSFDKKSKNIASLMGRNNFADNSSNNSQNIRRLLKTLDH